MGNITYENLREKWKNQRDAYREWELNLARSAFQFKNKFAKKIGLQDVTWADPVTGYTTPYVQLSDLRLENNSAIKHPSDELINDRGELVIGILLTLDHAENSFPKSHCRIPLVFKYIKNELCFGFWDTEEECLDQESTWYQDPDQLIEKILENISSHLSFDPMEGIPEKRGIGFLSK